MAQFISQKQRTLLKKIILMPSMEMLCVIALLVISYFVCYFTLAVDQGRYSKQMPIDPYTIREFALNHFRHHSDSIQNKKEMLTDDIRQYFKDSVVCESSFCNFIPPEKFMLIQQVPIKAHCIFFDEDICPHPLTPDMTDCIKAMYSLECNLNHIALQEVTSEHLISDLLGVSTSSASSIGTAGLAGQQQQQYELPIEKEAKHIKIKWMMYNIQLDELMVHSLESVSRYTDNEQQSFILDHSYESLMASLEGEFMFQTLHSLNVVIMLFIVLRGMLESTFGLSTLSYSLINLLQFFLIIFAVTMYAYFHNKYDEQMELYPDNYLDMKPTDFAFIVEMWNIYVSSISILQLFFPFRILQLLILLRPTSQIRSTIEFFYRLYPFIITFSWLTGIIFGSQLLCLNLMMRELSTQHQTLSLSLVNFLEFSPFTSLSKDAKFEVFAAAELFYMLLWKLLIWIIFVTTLIYLFNKSVRIQKKLIRQPADAEELENVIKEGDQDKELEASEDGAYEGWDQETIKTRIINLIESTKCKVAAINLKILHDASGKDQVSHYQPDGTMSQVGLRSLEVGLGTRSVVAWLHCESQVGVTHMLEGINRMIADACVRRKQGKGNDGGGSADKQMHLKHEENLKKCKTKSTDGKKGIHQPSHRFHDSDLDDLNEHDQRNETQQTAAGDKYDDGCLSNDDDEAQLIRHSQQSHPDWTSITDFYMNPPKSCDIGKREVEPIFFNKIFDLSQFLQSYGLLKPQILMTYSHYRFRIVVGAPQVHEKNAASQMAVLAYQRNPLNDLRKLIEILKEMGCKIKVLYLIQEFMLVEPHGGFGGNNQQKSSKTGDNGKETKQTRKQYSNNAGGSNSKNQKGPGARKSNLILNDSMMNNLMKMKKQYPYLSWTWHQNEIDAFCAMLPYQ